MKIIHHTKLVLLLLLGTSLISGISLYAGGISVRLGRTVKRDYEDVQKDKYAYGPKQDYDRETKTTHIYLPYGNNPKLYEEVQGILTDPSPENGVGKFKCHGPNNGTLCYKISFDRPIKEFRFWSGRFEYGLTPETVAGIEYSTNGRDWKKIREIKGEKASDKGIHKVFVENFKAEGLNARTLYIRYYSRNMEDTSKQGTGRWIQLWLAGNPNWGDVAKTFFIHHPQIWVKKK